MLALKDLTVGLQSSGLRTLTFRFENCFKQRYILANRQNLLEHIREAVPVCEVHFMHGFNNIKEKWI